MIRILPCVLLVLSPAARAADWDRFRGPNGTGVAADASVPSVLDLEKTLLWRVPSPPGHSSPIVKNGRVFLTGYEGDRLLTICLSAGDGRLVWKQEAPRSRREKVDARNSPASPTPAADAAAIYVFFGDYGLLSYTFDGRERWRTPLGPFHNVYGMGASPVVAGDRVILVVDHGPGSYIAAFRTSDGKQIWKTPRPEALSGASTPIVWQPKQGPAQVIAPASFRLDAYSVENGEPVWWVRGLPSEMKSTPSLAMVNGEELLIVSGYNAPENDPGKQVAIDDFAEVLKKNDANGDGKIDKTEVPDKRTEMYFPFLDLDGDGKLDAAEWKSYQNTMQAVNSMLALKPGGKGDVTESAVRWKYFKSIPQCPSPLLLDGLIYMLRDNGALSVLDAATGTLVRESRVRGIAEPYYASPVAAGGMVWFASHKGVVTAMVPGREEKVAGVTDFGEEITATPAFAAGRMVVRTSKAVYCFVPRQ